MASANPIPPVKTSSKSRSSPGALASGTMLRFFKLLAFIIEPIAKNHVVGSALAERTAPTLGAPAAAIPMAMLRSGCATTITIVRDLL